MMPREIPFGKWRAETQRPANGTPGGYRGR
jgi:hypothetical protein